MDVTSLTYDELADRLGITPASARNLVRRRKWKRTQGNDGRARIAVPIDALPEAPQEAPSTPPQEAPSAGALEPHQDLSWEIAALRELVEAERRRGDAEAARVEEVRARLVDLAADRDRWHALATRPWWRRLAG